MLLVPDVFPVHRGPHCECMPLSESDHCPTYQYICAYLIDIPFLYEVAALLKPITALRQLLDSTSSGKSIGKPAQEHDMQKREG